MSRVRLLPLAAALAILAVDGAHAQRPATVTIDVVALTASGERPERLAPEDFQVRLDGRTYPVTAIRRTPGPAPGPAPLWPAPYGRNDAAASRTMAVLVDAARLPADGHAALTAGLKSLTSALGPADRLALIPLTAEARPVDFTTTHARIVEAAGALPLGTAPAAANDRDQEAAALSLIDGITRVAIAIGDTTEVKPLLVVAAPFEVNGRVRRAIQALAPVVAQQRIALYVAGAGGKTAGRPAGLNELTAATGGAVLGADWRALATQETGRVTLTVTTDGRLDAGEAVRSMVTTSRTDVTVRAPAQAWVRTGDPDALESLTDMVRAGRTFTDLPLRLAAYPVLHSDRASIRLLIVAETIEPGPSLQWTEFALVTPDGRLVSQWKEPPEALTERPLIAGALAPEGTYRLRWAASELSGRRGTVDVDVDARLAAAGPFRLSALMLGRLTADSFVPVLQPDAEADALEWYAEVYGEVAAGQTLGARVEVRARPDAAALVSESGRVLTSPDPLRRAVTGRLEVAALPPGDYEVRAILTINGADAGHVARTFHKAR